MALGATYFSVILDGLPFPNWTSVSGVSFGLDIAELAEGGNQFFKHFLPQAIKHEPITLTRPVGAESNVLQSWFSSFLMVPRKMTAAITAFGPDSIPLHSTTLMGVIPVSYKLSDMTAGNNQPLTETLTLRHQGPAPNLAGAVMSIVSAAVSL